MPEFTCGSRVVCDRALDLVEPLDPEGPGGVEEGGQQLLRHVDLAGVSELQHGLGLVSTSVLQDDDRVLAWRLLESDRIESVDSLESSLDAYCHNLYKFQ